MKEPRGMFPGVRTAIKHALCASVASLCACQGDTAKLPSTAPVEAICLEEQLPGMFGEGYFGVYLEGKKVGFAWSRYRKDSASGEYIHENRLDIRTTLFGVVLTSVSSSSRRYAAAPPHVLLEAVEEEQERGRSERYSLTRSSKCSQDYVLEVRSGMGAVTQKSVTTQESLLPIVVAQVSALHGEPGVRTTYPAFSIPEGRDREVTLELKGRETTVRDGVRLTLCTLDQTIHHNDSLLELQLDTTGQWFRLRIGDAMEMRLEGKEQAQSIDASVDVPQILPISVQGFPPKTTSLARVRLRWSGSSVLLPDREFQRVRWDIEGSEQIVDVLQPVPPNACERDAAVPEDVAANLESDPVDGSDTGIIQALARTIVGETADPWTRAQRINDWVSKEILDKYSENSTTALSVLERRVGDCTEHTVLASGLLRAAGVPARRVSGVIYGGQEFDAYMPHAWIEVWIGRWIPIDPTLGQSPADVTHVYFGGEFDTRLMSLRGMRVTVLESFQGRSTNER